VPHVGTWIEIVDNPIPFDRPGVVPHVGTWIEIVDSQKITAPM